MTPLEAAATLREFALLDIGPTLREAIAWLPTRSRRRTASRWCR